MYLQIPSLTGLWLAGTLLLPAQTPPVSEHQISQAEVARKQYPSWSPAAAALGAAYVMAARETGDPAYLAKASLSTAESLKLEPNNPAALKVQARILLEKHDDVVARGILEGLRKRGPDDLEVSSLLCRAYLALGQYARAEEAAQFIRDLRPAELMGYHRAAEMREVYGDLGGALAYYRESFVRTPIDEPQEKAYLLVQMARLMWITGNENGAGQALQQSQQMVPGYYLAAVERAREAVAKGDAQAALEAVPDRKTPSLEWQYARLLALSRAGETAKAQSAEKQFVAQARTIAPALLARAYLDVTQQAALALPVMEEQSKTRQDVETLHLLAWARFANGQLAPAAEAMEKALRVGVRDPEILFHAAQIAQARGDMKAAAQYERELTALNSNSPFLARLKQRSGT